MMLFLIVCLFLISFANRPATAETLRFATGFSPKHTMQVKVFEPWAKQIEQRTNGKVKVVMYPGGALGKMQTLYDLAEKGIADISYTLHDYTPGRFPMTEVYSLPFMTPTAEKTSMAMWKTYEQSPDFQKEYDKVKLLALFCHPGGDLHTTKIPVHKLEDLKGLKIRTASPYGTEALKIYKATPISMPITETYTALERGVVDGTVAPWEGLGVFKLDDLVRYSLEIDFYTMTMMVVMNKRKWDSLPEDVKKIIDDTTGLKMSVAAGKAYDETDQPFKQQAVSKGVKVFKPTQEEITKLKNLTKPLRKEWIQKCASKGLDAHSVLKTSLQLLEID